MNIAFITTHYPPSIGFGGVCESGYGLSNALARAGISVDVVTSDATKGTRISLVDFENLERERLRINPFKYSFSEKSCFSFSAKRVIKNLVAESDLIHVNGIYTHPATLGARCARQAGKPHLVAVRNGLDPWMMRINRLKKMLGFKLYVQADLKGATCIHTTAQQEIDACLAMGINRPFTIIPNGINASAFSELPEPEYAEELWPVLKDRRVILFLSRLSKQKGLDIIIPSWNRIMKKHPDAILVIAGPDYQGYGDFVRNLANKSYCSDEIIFTANVTGQKKLALYSRANIFVLPSYTENFGNVVAEALACGVPVVTTQATPWKEVEEFNCGRWVPVDEDAIIGRLDELLNLSETERYYNGERVGKDL